MECIFHLSLSSATMLGRNQLLSLLIHVLNLINSVNGAIREPWVKNVQGFFDKQDCTTLIEAAEKFGFPLTGEF